MMKEANSFHLSLNLGTATAHYFQYDLTQTDCRHKDTKLILNRRAKKAMWHVLKYADPYLALQSNPVSSWMNYIY